MLRFTVRKAALVGAVLAAVVSPVRADDCCPPAPCAPQMRTVYVTECVPQTYQVQRTVYHTECRQQHYTAYRCECIPVVRERVVTCYKNVPECREVVRRVCVSVPCVEERVVMKPCWTYQTVTTFTTRCVDRGHYECREVYSHCQAFKNRLHKHRHRHDCCPPPCPPPTKTVKCWVPCIVKEQVPHTKCCKVCVMKPTCVRVCTCRKEWREQRCMVTCCRCVPYQVVQKCTVWTTRQVPYQACRTVRVCVPHTQMVTCTRYVTRCVARQVPCCETCCPTVCCSAKHGHGGRWFRSRQCCH